MDQQQKEIFKLIERVYRHLNKLKDEMKTAKNEKNVFWFKTMDSVHDIGLKEVTLLSMLLLTKSKDARDIYFNGDGIKRVMNFINECDLNQAKEERVLILKEKLH